MIAFVTAAVSSWNFLVTSIEDYDAAQVWFVALVVATIGISLHLFRVWWFLRHIPGPFLASLTNLQRVWWVKTGQAHLYHQAAHAKYGNLVRIGPHMVSFSKPEAIATVYPIRPGFPKVCIPGKRAI